MPRFLRALTAARGDPLLVTLVCVDFADVVFAVDSIPAFRGDAGFVLGGSLPTLRHPGPASLYFESQV